MQIFSYKIKMWSINPIIEIIKVQIEMLQK